MLSSLSIHRWNILLVPIELIGSAFITEKNYFQISPTKSPILKMKLFAASAALALLATMVQAVPTPADTVSRYFSIEVIFQGAANAEFTQSFPADGRLVTISMLNFLPISLRSFAVSIPTFNPLLSKFSSNLSPSLANPLSISHIISLGGGTCTFYGIDGSVTTTVGAQTVDVGPPQTQVRGECRAF